MDREAYLSLRNSQEKHWWFVGRRKIVRELIATHVSPPANAHVLEAGCGYGGNLPMLGEFGDLSAFEYDDEARVFSAEMSGIDVVSGMLPDGVDLGRKRFDLIAMLDVLEHIEDEIESLETLRSYLTPGGRIVVTVPAFPWLWSAHDELHHHKRRYSREHLTQSLNSAGFTPVKIGYFNSLLFPLALAERAASRFAKGHSAHEMPAKMLNSALGAIFGFEEKLVGKIPLPFGLSLFAIAENRSS